MKSVLDGLKSGETSIVILEGLTRHGKNRINQHGSVWQFQKIDKFNGQPAFKLISLDKTFKCGDEWIHDGRWVLIDNDPNFNWS